MAAVGSAVFVGHCASEALKDTPGVLRVFIRSSEEEKRKRITEKYGIAESKVESTMRKFDHKRANYYYVNTSRKWTDFNNYDMILDSGNIGVDGCVSILKAILCKE